ncbi:MAG: SigB/SigF/SigG family RNA polymerase sigma factor [Armatimonadetes bacterium]|nr:SigB/SigF/SigG family RNA polymerase sigma factor [Armatimonadota bacterium]
MIGDKNTPGATKTGSAESVPLAPYSLINPPPTLETPLSVDIPLLPPGELERLSVEHSHTRDTELRDRLVMYHQRLVRSLAGRFSGTGELLEDLIQVGNIGLINALDRFDATQGTRFSTYATPTILGEIKRYFRDKSATIKVPRWLQELSHHVRREQHILSQETGRPPTPAEIAERMEMSEADIRMALESGEVSSPLSLDSQMDMATDTASLFDLIGRPDAGLSEFEAYGDLRSAMQTLHPREREVISLRFFDEMSQAKIAKQLDISQMHVSRLQQRALRRLRELLSDDEDTRRVSHRRVSATPH